MPVGKWQRIMRQLYPILALPQASGRRLVAGLVTCLQVGVPTIPLLAGVDEKLAGVGEGRQQTGGKPEPPGLAAKPVRRPVPSESSSIGGDSGCTGLHRNCTPNWRRGCLDTALSTAASVKSLARFPKHSILLKFAGRVFLGRGAHLDLSRLVTGAKGRLLGTRNLPLIWHRVSLRNRARLSVEDAPRRRPSLRRPLLTPPLQQACTSACTATCI